MPVTGGKKEAEISQRKQYAKGGVGRKYWDFRDRCILAQVGGPRILDAGCGEGITLQKLIEGFPEAEIEAVDIDSENVRICGEHGLRVRQASLYDLPYKDASFDTVLLVEVIEHLDAPEKALAELARVTRLGGRFIIVYPVDWAMLLARVLCLRFREAVFDPGQTRQWTWTALKRATISAGYRPIFLRGLPLSWPLMLHGLCVAEREG